MMDAVRVSAGAGAGAGVRAKAKAITQHRQLGCSITHVGLKYVQSDEL